MILHGAREAPSSPLGLKKAVHDPGLVPKGKEDRLGLHKAAPEAQYTLGSVQNH